MSDNVYRISEIEEQSNSIDKEIEQYNLRIMELEAQRARLIGERRSLLVHKNQEMLKFIVDNKDIVLKLIGDHDRTSCSDLEHNNGFGSSESGGYRCKRCAILDIIDSGFPEAYDNWSIQFEPMFTKTD